MREKCSVFALFVRSSLYRMLGLFAIMGLVEALVFYFTWASYAGSFSFAGVLHTPELVWLVQNAHLTWCFGGTFLLLTAQLCQVGCEFSSKSGYVLRRLSLSHRWVYAMQALGNFCFYLLLWAAQALVLLGLSAAYMHFADSTVANHQTVYLAFYRSDFLHSILPLDEKSVYLRNLILALTLGLGTAAVPYHQRRRRVPFGAVILLGITCGFFVRALGNSGADYVVSFAAVCFSLPVVYNVMAGGDVDA